MMEKSAIISTCSTYRYMLTRQWDRELPTYTFIMLNPSTADHEIDDPTIRRCIGYTKSWGGGTLQVVNLFALRSVNPLALRSHNNPIGSDNDRWVQHACKEAITTGGKIILAWGAHGIYKSRDLAMLATLMGWMMQPYVLALTNKRIPKHPLYLRKDLIPLLVPDLLEKF